MNMEKLKIIDSMPLAALTVGQAKEVINNLFLDLGYRQVEKPKPQPDTMGIDDLTEFLKEHGFPVNTSTIYNWTFKLHIPYSRIGKRLVFSRKDMLQWLESKTTRIESQSEATMRISESINRKG